MTTANDPRSEEPLDRAGSEADPADVAEQQTLAVDDDGGAVEPIGNVGEADPADVYEQAIHVGSDDDAWSRG